ncbi:sulfotransferase [Candidatus Pseudothioglobus singularis]|nr:sulfotransferase [Candidatus Pseudothioglobus singularis]
MSIKLERLLKRAKKFIVKGKMNEAESLYSDILVSFPDNKDAQNGLLMIKKNRNQTLPPITDIQSAVSFATNGRIKDALDIVEPLIKNFSNEPLLFNIRGVCNKANKDYQAALEDFSQAVMLNPKYAEAYYNLGVTYGELGDILRAVSAYENALSINKNYPTAQNNLGQILLIKGDFDASIDHLEWAVALKPDFAEAYNNLGNAFLGLNNLNDAIKSFKKAIFLKSDFAIAINNLGISYLRIGDQELAKECFENAISIVPAYATAHHNLSGVKVYKARDSQVEFIESILSKKNLSPQDRIYFSFTLAKINEDLGNHEELFKNLREGNEIRKKEMNYSMNKPQGHNELMKLFFNSKSIKKINQLYNDSSSVRPIFIVGMPRSGTSLVEQIISSHHNVYGAGELKNFNNIIIPLIKEHFKNDNFNLTLDEFSLIRKQYLDSLFKINVNEKVITDKWPLNFRSIGFILSAFPEAKVIHLKRDARATCWSIYKHYFSDEGNGWAYDFDDLAKFYELYVELMGYWHKLYPGKIYDISYEELTSNQEKETRKIIEYCDLEWDPSCLNFQENKRDVKTASSLQVRKKIYKGSSEVWRQYEEYLDPLIKSLSNF